ASSARGRRRLVFGFALLSLLVGGALGLAGAPRPAEGEALAAGIELPPPPAPDPVPVPVAPSPAEPRRPGIRPAPRPDAHLNREGYGHIPGGIVFVPSTFSSDDGEYDLYLHFHGNTRVVLESAEHAGLNAIVAVVNLGVNSAPYLDAYEMPGSYERTLG